MIPDSFTLRRAAIAILFPGQPALRREERLEFYDKVTAAGIDVPQFNQAETAVQLMRTGSGSRASSFQIQAGHHEDKFRFLVAEIWPRNRTLKVIGKDADTAWQCFQKVWPPSRLGRKPVLVEVTIRTAVSVRGGDATAFLRDKCFRMSGAGLSKLGRQLEGLGLKIMLPVEVGMSDEGRVPLDAAAGTIQVETLREDPSRLYIEAQFRWPSVPVPREVREQRKDAPERLNPEIRRPSAYLDESDDFLKNELTDFLLELAKE